MLEEFRTFIKLSEIKSFTKASEVLFISPTAIMKQMNSLESIYNVKLLLRSNKGISLTNEGQKVLEFAKKIVKEFDESIKSVSKENVVLRVGTSILNPAHEFLEIFDVVNEILPKYKIQIVNYDDDHNNILKVINELGKSIDFLIGICDSPTWLTFNNFLQLCKAQKCLALNKKDPLAKLDSISFKDIEGRDLVMVKKGDSPTNNMIREYIKRNYPTINIIDAPLYYDIDVFNYCYEHDYILLSTLCWENVHPLLKTIPLKEDFTIPYGILYSKYASKNVNEFIKVVKELIKNNKI